MIKFKKVKLDRIKKISKAFVRILEERSFLVSLALIFLIMVSGAIIFYKYSVLADRREPEVLGGRIYFQEETFKNIMKVWEDRQKRFEEADLKTYPNPFRVD